MPWGASAGSLRSVGASRGIGIKDAVVANASEALAALLGQIVTDGYRVVTGVEDEQRHFLISWKEPDQAPDLLCRDLGRVRAVA